MRLMASLMGEDSKMSEIIDLYSPFETSEMYIPSSSCITHESPTEASTNFAEMSCFMDIDTELSSIPLGSSLSPTTQSSLVDDFNLEPGTYTLDVLNLDTLCSVTDDTSNVFIPTSLENINNEPEPPNAMYHMEAVPDTTSTNPTSDNSSLSNTTTAREFLNQFSNDLCMHEKEAEINDEELPKTPRLSTRSDQAPSNIGQKESAEEDKNLSWLMNFNVSSIFSPESGEEDSGSDNANKGSNNHENTSGECEKKPRYTYTELIEQALNENGELTVSGIYNWISNHYPYYKRDDDRWKNSVRHNLSINPQFRKGKKACQGAGHFWNISAESVLPKNTTPTPAAAPTVIVVDPNQIHSANQCNVVPPQVAIPTIDSSNTAPVNLQPIQFEEKTSLVTHNQMMNQLDTEQILTGGAKTLQQDYSMDMNFTDVSLQQAANHLHPQLLFQPTADYYDNNYWESGDNHTDQTYSSLSSLIREITDNTVGTLDDDNFLIEDISDSMYLGDEFFNPNELSSPFYGLATI